MSAAFTPDGGRLLTGDTSGRLMLWDVADGHLVDTKQEHGGAVNDIDFAADGRTFVTASSDRTLVVWDAKTCEPMRRLRGHLGEIDAVAISRDGQVLASGSAMDGTTELCAR
jgi:WD40 repeat protein